MTQVKFLAFGIGNKIIFILFLFIACNSDNSSNISYHIEGKYIRKLVEKENNKSYVYEYNNNGKFQLNNYMIMTDTVWTTYIFFERNLYGVFKYRTREKYNYNEVLYDEKHKKIYEKDYSNANTLKRRFYVDGKKVGYMDSIQVNGKDTTFYFIKSDYNVKKMPDTCAIWPRIRYK